MGAVIDDPCVAKRGPNYTAVIDTPTTEIGAMRTRVSSLSDRLRSEAALQSTRPAEGSRAL